MWERLGFDLKEVMPLVDGSDGQIRYRRRLFSRIVPIVKDIGLWSEPVQKALRRARRRALRRERPATDARQPTRASPRNSMRCSIKLGQEAPRTWGPFSRVK